MNARFLDWWQSTLAVGGPLLPYVGLALLVVLLIAALVLCLYVLWRLSRRLPPALRYLGWRIALLVRKIGGRGAQASAQPMMARLTDAGDLAPLDEAFSASRWRRWTGGSRRPPQPLWLVMGPSDASCSAFMRRAAFGDAARTEAPGPTAAELTWWPLHDRLALQVPTRMTSGSARTELAALQKNLSRMDARQPMNGLVLVMPVHTLLQAAPGDPGLDDLVRSVATLSTASGFRLPVYVVVAEMQTLAGYADFAQVLADAGDHRYLGWRPARSQPADLGRAIESWFVALKAAALAAIVKRPPAAVFGELNDAVVLLTSLSPLVPRLSELAARFAAVGSKADSPLPLGGIYLASLAPRHGATASSSDVDTQPWLNHLQFASQEPLQPSEARSARSRRRAALVLSGLVASIALMVWWVPRSVTAIQQDAHATQAELSRSRDNILSAAAETFRADEQAAKASDLLGSISRVSEAGHARLLAPTSWFGSEHRRLLELLGKALQHLVVVPRLEKLAGELPAALATEHGGAAQGVPADRVEELPAYERLLGFLRMRERAGRSRQTIESVSSGITYQELYRFLGHEPRQQGRVDWAWNQPLPGEVVAQLDASAFWSRGDDEQVGGQLLVDHWNLVLAEALDGHPVLVLTQELASAMERLARSQDLSQADAAQLGGLLQRLRREVELPGARRLLGKQTDTLGFFNSALLTIGRSPEATISQTTEMGSAVIRRRDSARKKLQVVELAGVGPVFVADSEGSLALSPEVRRFSVLYGALMSQRFMQPAPAGPYRALPATDAGIRWNSAQLEVVRSLAVAFREFATTGVAAMDPALRPGLLRLAQAQARLVIDAAFWQAAQADASVPDLKSALDPAGQMRPQVSSLLTAVGAYRQIVPEELQNRETARLLADEIQRQLTVFEALLKTEDPYGAIAVEVRAWMAQPSPAKPLAAFIRASTRERLALARDYVRTQYSAPVAQLLDALAPLADLTRTADSTPFWRRLLAVLDAHDKSASANGLFEFEQYVSALGKWSGPDECQRFLDEREPSAGRSDYFSHRLSTLEDLVSKECGVRAVATRRLRYQELAKWFNEQLAGRTPFGANSALDPLSRRSFANSMARYRELRRPLGDVKGWPQGVVDFVSRMDEVAARFSPQRSATTEGKTAAAAEPVEGDVRARLELRITPPQAALIEHIIDVEMSVGTRRHGLRNPGDVFEWHPGEPVEVRLRWAGNSPYAPVASADKTGRYAVAERTAVFRFDGDWAVADLLRAHQVRGDSYTQATLQFPVTVVGSSGRETARFFMRLSSVNDQTPLALDFPTQAPALPAAFAPDLLAVDGQGGRR